MVLPYFSGIILYSQANHESPARMQTFDVVLSFHGASSVLRIELQVYDCRLCLLLLCSASLLKVLVCLADDVT